MYEFSNINHIKLNNLNYLVMRKIYKFLIPAFIAVVLCSACEDPMEGMAIEEAPIEAFSELPPKNKIKLPPGYDRPETKSESTSDSDN